MLSVRSHLIYHSVILIKKENGWLDDPSWMICALKNSQTQNKKMFNDEYSDPEANKPCA